MEDNIQHNLRAIKTICIAANLRDQAHIFGPIGWWLAIVYAKRQLGVETHQPSRRCIIAVDLGDESEYEDE